MLPLLNPRFNKSWPDINKALDDNVDMIPSTDFHLDDLRYFKEKRDLSPDNQSQNKINKQIAILEQTILLSAVRKLDPVVMAEEILNTP